MASHTIVQFDELPVWTIKLGWLKPATFTGTDSEWEATWPPIPIDAKVTMIAKLASGTTQIIAAATVVDAAARTVRWDPTSAQTTVAGTYNVKWRITYANGKSQSHPETGFDALTISPAAVSTDVADPA